MAVDPSWACASEATRADASGGDLVVETLGDLGAEVVFGLPGVHALPIWDALRRSRLPHFVFRTELNAAFAAEAYGQISGKPAALIVSTGPGTLIALAGVMEAAVTYVPMLVIAPQVPREVQGRQRSYLHELEDQTRVVRPVAKRALTVSSIESLPATLAEAWAETLRPPAGPVYVGIPYDILGQRTAAWPRMPAANLSAITARVPAASDLAAAAEWLNQAQCPAIWAGGGVLAGAAWDELRAVAEALGAPVLTTYMGKGALREDHPLAGGSACEQPAYHELLESSDVVLAVGTSLGSETTAGYTLKLPDRLIQIDAAPERIGTTYPARALVGDARPTLRALSERLTSRHRDNRVAARRLKRLRVRIESGLVVNGQTTEQSLIDQIRRVLPEEAVHAWDSTILAYWAAEYFPAITPRSFLYPLGSGTIGYSWPAAIGASFARPEQPALAVCGDGGFAYGIAELATAQQYRRKVTLLLIDDGGYGILREYQTRQFGTTHAVDLHQPDFVSLCESFGVPTVRTSRDTLAGDLEGALAREGPAVVVLEAKLTAPRPTP